jgi:hypothetical protein
MLGGEEKRRAQELGGNGGGQERNKAKTGEDGAIFGGKKAQG